MNNMKAIILAGGYGTRLSEETEVLPKPMIELGGRPLLWHIMKIFSTQGINDFVIALGYKGEVIKRYFMQFPQLAADLRIDLNTGTTTRLTEISEAWNIDLINTGLNTMTGGRLKRLKDRIDGPVFFTYGDGLSNVDLGKLYEFHKSHGKLATVTAIQPPQRFGVLQLDGDRVTRFNEKAGCQDAWVNGGFFILEPEALDYIDDDSTSWEQTPCERLAAEGQLIAYRHSGYWQCVDTLHELRQLRETWDKGEAPWKIWD